MDLIVQEVSAERYIDIPERGARHLPALAARRRCIRAHRLGEGARHARRASTTSTRASRRPARTSPTPPSRRPTTTQGRHHAPDHRDRRRPVGHRAGATPARCSASSARSAWSARQLRPEALPRTMMRDLRRARCIARPRDLTDAGRDPGRRPGPPRVASASRSARPSRSPPPTRDPTTRWAACSTTCCCTRRSSARRRCCSSRRSARLARRHDRLRGRRLATSRGLSFPFLREKLAREARPAHSSPSSRRPARR